MKANLGQSTSTRAGALNSRKTFTNIENSPSKLQQPKYTFNKSDQYKLWTQKTCINAIMYSTFRVFLIMFSFLVQICEIFKYVAMK